MLETGTILGGRYEILKKIGTGGMADVYMAKCHKPVSYTHLNEIQLSGKKRMSVQAFLAGSRVDTGTVLGE